MSMWSRPSSILPWTGCALSCPWASVAPCSALHQAGSEILSWLIMVVIVVVLFALMQMVKPYISKKESTAQVVERIKEYYYSMYLQQGSLENFKAWLG